MVHSTATDYTFYFFKIARNKYDLDLRVSFLKHSQKYPKF